MSSGQGKISPPHKAHGVEVTHHEFLRVAANVSTPPPRPSAQKYSSTGNIINSSRSTSPYTSIRSRSVSTTIGGRGPKTMAKRLGHILSPRRGSNHRSNSNSSSMDDSGASMSVISDSDNATAQSIEGQQSVALTVDSHDTIKMSNKQHKKPSKSTHSAPSSDTPPPLLSPSSYPLSPTHVKRPRGWKKLKRLVGGGGRPPTAPGGTAASSSSPSKGAGDGGGFARPHSKSYDEGPMTSPPDRTSNRSRFESADLAADRKASSARALSAWDRSHLDLAIRGRLDGVDVLFLGPARRSRFPMPASSTTVISSSASGVKSPLHSILESWSWSSPPPSEVPQDTVVEEAEIKPQIYIDPLKNSFTGIPITYTAADLVSDMVWTSAGRDKPELIFEGYIPGGGDRWCVKLEEAAATTNTAKVVEPQKSPINMEPVVSATTMTTAATEDSHDDDEESWKGTLQEGSSPTMPPLQATFDDESTSHTVGTAETTDDGSTNLPTQKLWDNMWGSDKAPPIPSHMQIGCGSFDVGDGDGDDSKDDILQLASACSVPIDLDEDSFMIDGPEHLRSVHELVMVPIQRRKFDVALSIFNKLLRGLQQPENNKLEHLVGVTHHNIGLIHMCVGSFGDALEHFQRAVEIRKKCLPYNHPDIVVSLVREGTAYLALESYNDAVKSFESALAMTPAENATRAKILNNLGTAHFLLQDVDAALIGFTGALEIQRQWLDGPVRREPIIYDAAVSLGNMGKVYTVNKDYDLAFFVLEEACLLQMTSFRKDHQLVLSTLGSMAWVKAKNCNFQKASQIYDSIRRSQVTRFGTESQETVETIGMLAYVQIKEVDFDEALMGLKTVERWQAANLPPSHPAIRMTKGAIIAIEKCMKGTASVWI